MDRDSLIGEVIASRYRIEERVGSGAMGTVYRARHVKLGRPFAIKLLRPSLLGNETIRRRFAREAELAGSLHHPNLVGVVDLGETAFGLHYLVMEYADGETLYDLMRRTGAMPGRRVAAIMHQLCDGLAHAHRHGLIHRDFKPENVIVESESGRDHVKIVDFGIAILREDAVSSSPDRLTTAGAVIGTPRYMAPEQALGRPIDDRADLFALGVACFEMLTGASPFDGDGVDVARANVMTETPAMRDRVPGLAVDPLLEAFTRRLMMKSPDARLPSAAVARALIELIEHDRGAAVAALGIARTSTPPPGARRSPTPPPAIAVATERVASLQGAPAGPRGHPRPTLPSQIRTTRLVRSAPPARHGLLAALVFAAALAITLVAALVVRHLR